MQEAAASLIATPGERSYDHRQLGKGADPRRGPIHSMTDSLKKDKQRDVHRPVRRRVLLVDDHPIVSHGLRQLMAADHELELCGTAETVPQALVAATETHPDIMLIDISLGQSNGLDLVKTLRSRGVQVPILMLSMHDEDLYAERALRAGARGFVMKQEPAEVLLSAIHKVLDGKVHVSDRIASKILLSLGGKSPSSVHLADIQSLSDRELEIFDMIGGGRSTREIAKALELSVKTVETHRAHIKKKLGSATTAELLKRAFEHVSL